ncbi:hypothetical protein B7C51_16935 [Paenibacillus larvae subsp. pulvifaciens]|uniref:Uncharacterized protein n=1 Tax=Paenibacillus larvae subsp. pulvifaciens TaxID=1477 RepID=A0A1V0UV98_9BACL|nr:hypothetical protein B7C51_16935 [Paenibacillus larvae subsp. pulvifaciens]
MTIRKAVFIIVNITIKNKTFLQSQKGIGDILCSGTWLHVQNNWFHQQGGDIWEEASPGFPRSTFAFVQADLRGQSIQF